LVLLEFDCVDLNVLGVEEVDPAGIYHAGRFLAGRAVVHGLHAERDGAGALSVVEQVVPLVLTEVEDSWAAVALDFEAVDVVHYQFVAQRLDDESFEVGVHVVFVAIGAGHLEFGALGGADQRVAVGALCGLVGLGHALADHAHEAGQHFINDGVFVVVALELSQVDAVAGCVGLLHQQGGLIDEARLLLVAHTQTGVFVETGAAFSHGNLLGDVFEDGFALVSVLHGIAFGRVVPVNLVFGVGAV